MWSTRGERWSGYGAGRSRSKRPFRASVEEVVVTVNWPDAAMVTNGRAHYPAPSARVALLFVLGLSAFIVGIAESVDRVPPLWAALLAGVGAVMLTTGIYIYFMREVGRS